MPLWKFRSFEEAEKHLDHLPTTPDSSLGSALALLGLAEGARRGIRTAQRGLIGYRTIAEAEADRERFALERLRAAATPAPSLRPATDADLPFLFQLYADTRQEELAGVDWPAEQKEAFLRQQFEAQHAWYREQYAGASFDVVEVDGEPAGRLYVARWEREVRIVDVSLLSAHRGRGLGSSLLAAVLAEADAGGKPVSVHVERFNPALRLYVRLGFALREDKGVYLLLQRPTAARPGFMEGSLSGTSDAPS